MSTLSTIGSYPIQRRWLAKSFLNALPAVIFLAIILPHLFRGSDSTVAAGFIYTIFLAILTVSVSLQTIVAALRRSRFSYALDEKFLMVKQGILKKEERHIPYGVIQEVILQRSLLDRFLGLESISIHNASSSGTSVDEYGNTTRSLFGMQVSSRKNRSRTELVGFRGNMVHVPGLLLSDAKQLQTALLRKMKQYQSEDRGSGL